MDAVEALALRRQMIDDQIRARHVDEPRVLAAFEKVPRHLFVPPEWIDSAYADHPLPIGYEQTISQPYIVALMLASLQLTGTETVLEIGTGSGYQTALLAHLARYVISIERIEPLAERAAGILSQLGVSNIEVHHADGSMGLMGLQVMGLQATAPFAAIIAGAAAPTTPTPWKSQLAVGGRLILPVGVQPDQYLVRITRTDSTTWHTERGPDVRFVPLVGRYGFTSGSAAYPTA